MSISKSAEEAVGVSKLAEAIEAELRRAEGLGRSALRGLIAQLDSARERVSETLRNTREEIECTCSACKRRFRVTMSMVEERQRGIPETCVECFEVEARVNPRPWHGEAPVTSVYREPQFAYSRD